MVKLIELIATYVMAFSGILFVIGAIALLLGNFGTPKLGQSVKGCDLMGVRRCAVPTYGSSPRDY